MLQGQTHGQVLQAAHVPITTFSFKVHELSHGAVRDGSGPQAAGSTSRDALSAVQEPATSTTSTALPAADPLVSGGVPQPAASGVSVAEDEQRETQRCGEEDDDVDGAEDEDLARAEDDSADEGITAEFESLRTTTTRHDGVPLSPLSLDDERLACPAFCSPCPPPSSQ